MNDEKTIIIGGAAGAWGDSVLATPQLLRAPRLDYIIYEALAEITMAILTRLRRRNPDAGYAVDFIDPILRDNLQAIRARGIRVVTNAGGINPQAAAAALRTIAADQGLSLKVAVVAGDDLLPRVDDLRAAGVDLPQGLLALNAYLGAFPIAAALQAGADVVITGRVADSALVLGPLIHEFGWGAGDLDRLAQGSLAGHLLECGPQASGGVLTDWETVPDWSDVGYPLAEIRADGSFVLTKPPGSGGVVNRKSVTEQILYEIGNPRAYLLPDVTCDFADVRLEALGENRVRVTGARGAPPPPTYKATGLTADGYRLQFLALISGRDAARKGQRVADALLARVRRLFAERGWADFREVSVELLGAEATFGPHSRAGDTREVVLKLAVHHDREEALRFFAAEAPAIGLSMAQSLSGGGMGRPRPAPLIRVHGMPVPREAVGVVVSLDDRPVAYAPPQPPAWLAPDPPRSRPHDYRPVTGPTVTLPLLALAYGRAGDKGNICNVGIAARHPDFVPVLAQALTPDVVARYLAHLVDGPVERYALPGLDAFNFVLHDALGGGGTASLRFDPQGKGMAQQLLELALTVPAAVAGHPALWR